MLSDGALVSPTGRKSVPKRFKRTSQKGKRTQGGLVSVKSAPDLVEMKTRVESHSASAVDLTTSETKAIGTRVETLTSNSELDGKATLQLVSRIDLSREDEEGSSESDSDAPNSPAAKIEFY